MARVCSTGTLTTGGDTTDLTETAPISEVMRESGIIESKDGEEADVVGKSDSEAEADNDVDTDNDEEDFSILHPNKPSHIVFGKSTVKSEDLNMLKRLGYIGQKDDNKIRFAGDEVIPQPKSDEVVVFRSFFQAGLRFPMYEMITEILERFEIYLHQLSPKCYCKDQCLQMGPPKPRFKCKCQKFLHDP